jgi:hypothetical protein
MTTNQEDGGSQSMTRADVEELIVLRCIHGGHTTSMALLAHLGLSPIHALALDNVLSDFAQRGLLDHDGDAFILTEDAFTRLGTMGV